MGRNGGIVDDEKLGMENGNTESKKTLWRLMNLGGPSVMATHLYGNSLVEYGIAKKRKQTNMITNSCFLEHKSVSSISLSNDDVVNTIERTYPVLH